MRKKSTRKPARPATYSKLQVLFASATQPMSADKRTHHLARIWHGLSSLEQSAAPNREDWGACSDAVNLTRTLVLQGHAVDTHDLLNQAATALALAGKRSEERGVIRLDGPGIQAVRSVLEDYASALEQLPERIMVQCHRDTELRIAEISAGRGLAHGVKVVAL